MIVIIVVTGFAVILKKMLNILGWLAPRIVQAKMFVRKMADSVQSIIVLRIMTKRICVALPVFAVKKKSPRLKFGVGNLLRFLLASRRHLNMKIKFTTWLILT